MKGPSIFGQLLTAALALSSTVSAWPDWLPDVDALVVRDGGTSATQPPASETGTSKAADNATPTNNQESTATAGTPSGKDTSSITSANLNTGATGTDATKSTKKTGKQTATKHTTFNAEDAAGGIEMLTPATTTTTLYKVGETITWVWNYTSVQGTPSAVDVLLSCSTASETWTLTQNMSYKATQTYTWDSNAFQSSNVASPLLTEMYTLVIYDAESSISATAEAGYLAVYSGFTFGMYTPQPYQNLSSWSCVTCNSANRGLDGKALGFAISMSVITLLSFTWFVVGFVGML